MYQRRRHGWLRYRDFIILDLICLQVAFYLAYVLRFGFSFPYFDESYRSVALVMSFIDLFVLIFFDSLSNILNRGYYEGFKKTTKHVALVILFITFYFFIVRSVTDTSRLFLMVLAVIYFIIDYSVRLLWKRILIKYTHKFERRSLLIVTVEDNIETVLESVTINNPDRYRIMGIVTMEDNRIGQEVKGIKIVSDAKNATEYICREWVDEVLISVPGEIPFPQDLINDFVDMGITVHLELAKSAKLDGQKQFVERMGDFVVLTTSINTATSIESLFKRTVDILAGLAGCIITGILFIILAPFIYISSPGPIFFSQVRVGKNGKKFNIYKFRSMYMDAEERKKELMAQNRVSDGMMFKLDFDPRIIGSKQTPDGKIHRGIGNIIRDFSLDEFPQFLNILKGEMSLIGTRPPTVDEWEKYDLHHRSRLAIKPGLTGMWQASGRSNITDFEDVVKLDRQYISEWSMSLDVKILLKTVAVVFKREGSM